MNIGTRTDGGLFLFVVSFVVFVAKLKEVSRPGHCCLEATSRPAAWIVAKYRTVDRTVGTLERTWTAESLNLEVKEL